MSPSSEPLRLLFVCGRNRLRSPTAEQIFAFDDVETQSAGVSSDADVPLDTETVEWADVVLFMEREHQAKATRAFGPAFRGKRIVCLQIEDRYTYMAPELIKLLWDRVPRSVPQLVGRQEK